MGIPPELVNLIVTQFVEYEPLQLPHYAYGRCRDLKAWNIFCATSDPGFRVVVKDQKGIDYETTLVGCFLRDLISLSKLRLVSRQWNEAVSRLFKKQKWWNVQLDDKQSLGRAVACFSAPNVGLGDPVRNLMIDGMSDLQTFERVYYYDDERFEGQDVEDDYIVMNSYVDRIQAESWCSMRPEKAELHYDKSEEHTLLRHLFDRLSYVERFTVKFPGAASNSNLEAECYDMQGLEETMSSIQYGLRSPALQHLVDLSLEVPSTWHVGELAKTLSSGARDRLTRLRLVIVDATGPCGSPWYVIHEQGHNDSTTTEISGYGYAPGNVQVAYPNQENQDSLWDLVASCKNLESLAVEASHYLDLNRLNRKPAPKSRGLRNLSLYRIRTNVSSILKLLSATPGSDLPPAARRVNLEHVKIHSDGGNWEKVFDYLRTRCPNLELFRACQLTYFSEHPRFEYNHRPHENYSVIWTAQGLEGNNDEKSVARLYRKMVQKVGKPERYPVTDGPDDDSDWESDGEEW
ncbi:hypothetical protein CCHL11_07367 [Colletotrichum chlorophyti]|uniref:F-box domain-containing protein n=1 Tax=Colletotrichum chlorophyti TaxID=708187 RepID=A0A1Q8RA43_9PEZI|nr:hypothetical protein CCHL11_07367 [Colletotrichum chlorophyti]